MKLLIKLLFFLLVVTSDRMFADDGKTFTNSIGMEFVLIPAGDFLMGCSPGDNNCNKEEKPAHNVKLTNDYYMGKYPVTQGQWKAVMGKNPSWFQRKRCPEKNKNCDNYPVEQVNLDDLQEFIKKLNSSEPGKITVYRQKPNGSMQHAEAQQQTITGEMRWMEIMLGIKLIQMVKLIQLA